MQQGNAAGAHARNAWAPGQTLTVYYGVMKAGSRMPCHTEDTQEHHRRSLQRNEAARESGREELVLLPTGANCASEVPSPPTMWPPRGPARAR
jgi:hypothetical protein